MSFRALRQSDDRTDALLEPMSQACRATRGLGAGQSAYEQLPRSVICADQAAETELTTSSTGIELRDRSQTLTPVMSIPTGSSSSPDADVGRGVPSPRVVHPVTSRCAHDVPMERGNCLGDHSEGQPTTDVCHEELPSSSTGAAGGDGGHGGWGDVANNDCVGDEASGETTGAAPSRGSRGHIIGGGDGAEDLRRQVGRKIVWPFAVFPQVGYLYPALC